MGKVIKVIVTLLVILLILLTGLGAMIKFDVFGVGTDIFAPLMMDVPVVSNLLPDSVLNADTSSEDASNYNFETVEQAVEILKITEEMLKEKSQEADILSEQIAGLETEVARLKIFEENQLQFEADKAAFDQEIADGMTAADYVSWYETMDPANAAAIYEAKVGEVINQEAMQDFIARYENMKAAQAALILEEMTTTKMDQVAAIITGVSSQQSADILAAMDPATAAKITSYIYP